MVLRKDEKVEQEGIVEKQQRINKDWLVLSTNCATTNDKINVNIINAKNALPKRCVKQP